MLRTIPFFLLTACATATLTTPVPVQITSVEQSSGTTSLLIGLSPVNAKVVWASGVRGTWVRTVDGGATWTHGVVPGAELLQFRDVQALDANTAWLMSAGTADSARIYVTRDGGATWTLQYTNPDLKGFYDCFDFWDARRGLVVGDAVEGESVVLSTTEHIAGSNSSAQYRFLAGATSPTSGDSQRHKFTPSNSFYLSYYVKYSTNWVGSGLDYHPHEFYAMSTLDGDYDGPSQNYLTVYVEENYHNGGRPRLAMQDNKSVNTSKGSLPNNLIGVTENRSTAGCNGVVESNIASECYDAGSYWYNDKQLTGPVMFQPSAGAGYKNNWNFVEAYFQLNTIVNGVGKADGVMQYWFNGTLIIDRHDILFRTGAHPTLQFSQFLIAPYIGDGSPVDQSMFIDNLRVATGRIP
jgi:hypothetical protein